MSQKSNVIEYLILDNWNPTETPLENWYKQLLKKPTFHTEIQPFWNVFKCFYTVVVLPELYMFEHPLYIPRILLLVWHRLQNIICEGRSTICQSFFWYDDKDVKAWLPMTQLTYLCMFDHPPWIQRDMSKKMIRCYYCTEHVQNMLIYSGSIHLYLK